MTFDLEASPGAVGPCFPNGDGDGHDPVTGQFLPGNQIARTCGLFAQQKPVELRERVERFAAGVLSDLGGEPELSTLERSYVGRLAAVEMTLLLLADDIEAHGLITPAGGVRKVYGQMLAGIDRWDRLAQRLGMRRRARPVPSARDIIAEYDRRAQEESRS